MNYKIPFSGKAHNYTDEEIDVVIKTMRNSSTFTQGENLKLFEKNFCNFIGTNHSFALSSAASGLEIAAQLCQFQPGDEIIIPAHTYTASAYPFIKHGAKIVWADIDLETRVINPSTLINCISPKTKAIVVVHLYGYGADMPEIMKIAKKNNLIVIEDVAQALGVVIDKKKAGSYGDFGIFSFHSHKNITTLGEGGMITTNNEKYAKIIPQLRHNGHCEFNFQRDCYWKPAMGNVDIPDLNGKLLWPNNYCLGEIQCALGSKLLNRIDSINIDKAKRAHHFIDSLSNNYNMIFHKVDYPRHNYHLLVARLIDMDRDLFISRMASLGIQCVVQYYPLYRYDLYKKVGKNSGDCPNTDIFFDSMVSFPFQQTLKINDLDWMIDMTKKCIKEINAKK